MDYPILRERKESVYYAHLWQNVTSRELHGHRHYVFTLKTRGTSIECVNGKDYIFSPRDILFLSPIDFHSYASNDIGGGDHYAVCFNFDTLDPELSYIYPANRFPMFTTLSEPVFNKVCALLKELCDENIVNLPSPIAMVYQKTLIEHILILAMQARPKQPSYRVGSFYSKSLGYIYSHFREDISVDDIAAFIGYTPNHFNMVFRRSFGEPFGKYLRKTRINYAKNMLIAGDAPVTEIAIESGFASLSHFSRTFKAEFNMSPNEYRKCHHNPNRQTDN